MLNMLASFLRHVLGFQMLLVAVADLTLTSQQLEAFNYYKKNTMSIEVLKDDNLQKVNFRVKNKVTFLTARRSAFVGAAFAMATRLSVCLSR